jgi:hypothetical protein
LPLRVCSHPILIDKKTNQNFSHHTLQLSFSISSVLGVTSVQALLCPPVLHTSTRCLVLNPSCLDPGNSRRNLLNTLALYKKLLVSTTESRNVQHMIQPFLAARHGFLLNGADSPESPEETPEIEDGFLDTEDGLLETEGGLLETEDDESLFETENDEESLADEGEGFLEEEGDGLLTSDDAPAREE